MSDTPSTPTSDDRSLKPIPPEIDWGDLNWNLKEEKAPWILLILLNTGAKFESLFYSLAIGILAGSSLILLLNYFPPLALVIFGGLSIGSSIGGLMWWQWSKKATLYQKILIILAALLIAGLFILAINFVAIPTLGVNIALTGTGFLTAATNSTLALIIGIGILQMLVSGMSAWISIHPRNSANTLKNAHSLTKALGLSILTKIGPSYSFSEKAYLSYGFLISSVMGLGACALSYYGITQLLPLTLMSLGLSLSLSSPILIPLVISLLVVSALITSKQLMASFIKKAEQYRSERLSPAHTYIPSLLETLLNKNNNIDFNQQPWLKIQQNLLAFWRTYFSYQHYQNYQKNYYPHQIYLTKNEFRLRNFLSLTLLLPFTLLSSLIKPLLSFEYLQTLNANMATPLFWKNPFSYSFYFLKFTSSYLFSYSAYKARHPETKLSPPQFYLRNTIIFTLIPLIISIMAVNFYTQFLDTSLWINIFRLSETTALIISNISNTFITVFASPLLFVLLSTFSPVSLLKNPSPRPRSNSNCKANPSAGKTGETLSCSTPVATAIRSYNLTPAVPPASDTAQLPPNCKLG